MQLTDGWVDCGTSTGSNAELTKTTVGSTSQSSIPSSGRASASSNFSTSSSVGQVMLWPVCEYRYSTPIISPAWKVLNLVQQGQQQHSKKLHTCICGNYSVTGIKLFSQRLPAQVVQGRSHKQIVAARRTANPRKVRSILVPGRNSFNEAAIPSMLLKRN